MQHVDAYADAKAREAMAEHNEKFVFHRDGTEARIEAEVRRRYNTRVASLVTSSYMNGAKDALAKLARHDAAAVLDRHAYILEEMRRGHP